MREGKGSDKTTLAVFFVPSDRLDIRSLGTAVKTFVAELIMWPLSTTGSSKRKGAKFCEGNSVRADWCSICCIE